MPELPGHLYLGRSAMSGPCIGGYAMPGFGPRTLAAGGTGTDQIWVGFVAPCDMRLYAINWYSRTRAATITANFYKKAAGDFNVTGATRINTTAALSLAAASSGQILPVGSSGQTDTLIQTARDISRGDAVFMAVTFDVTGAVADLGITFVVAITGHAQSSSVND